MPNTSPVYLHCSLCGLEFEKVDSVCEHGCPLGTTCGHVRCPGCGFEFPDPTRVGGLMDVPDLDALVGAMNTEAAAEAMASDGVVPETLVVLVEA